MPPCFSCSFSLWWDPSCARPCTPRWGWGWGWCWGCSWWPLSGGGTCGSYGGCSTTLFAAPLAGGRCGERCCCSSTKAGGGRPKLVGGATTPQRHLSVSTPGPAPFPESPPPHPAVAAGRSGRSATPSEGRIGANACPSPRRSAASNSAMDSARVAGCSTTPVYLPPPAGVRGQGKNEHRQACKSTGCNTTPASVPYMLQSHSQSTQPNRSETPRVHAHAWACGQDANKHRQTVGA
jgi:hypothetical protein